MKFLYFGGQKSGKSLLAEQKALNLAGNTRPYYIATYDNSYGDDEMQKRITTHQEQRKKKFTTIEETLYPSIHIQQEGTYLIDCMSMWILNTISWNFEDVLAEVKTLYEAKANIVFVLNDVNSGIIPIDGISREYVDRSGIVGQKLAQLCDTVYEVRLGLEHKLK
ncbi:cobinamide phosphate guanylyltransferase [Sulfurovum lithotrophicum]|uniref:Adenosylcobinamide kinase n=1 Tax=Sulfurovum lithotrophicum TaxID=206403 RepID=A0A7U4RQY6_9BACT|nr:bifunctional adenosylcobinamide kinase/adenosylcobinamide-phosphate guanylyltransferase [Sulfurovum lithotrophicum]AKF25226.1 cobinamide phosphate guanylyltransferase [Sulfurovum lithotrophicum]